MLTENKKQFLVILAILIGFFSFQQLLHLFLPFLLGILFALILNIPLHIFEDHILSGIIPKQKKKHRRLLSVFLSLVFILGILLFVLFLILPKISEAAVTLLEIMKNGTDFPLDLNVLPWTSMDFQLPGLLSSSLGVIVDLFLGIVFSIYILAQKELLKKQLLDLLTIWFPHTRLPLLLHVIHVCSTTFRNFIVGQSIEALVLGSLCTLGMLLLQLPYALTIGILVGVTAFIPFVGAYLGAVIGSVLILATGTFQVLVFLIFLITLQQIEGNVIYPRVVGSRIDLPSMWVLFSLIIGGRLAGPLGMLIGVPAFSVVYHLSKEATAHRKQKL